MFNLTIHLIEDSISYQRTISTILTQEIKQASVFLKSSIIQITNVLKFYKNLEHEKISTSDIFIIDIDLNTYFDGVTLGKKIREQSSECKIIYLTSFENKGIEIINANIFPEGYILKSANIEDVIFQIMGFLKKINADYIATDNQLLISNGSQKFLIPYKEILYIFIMQGMRNNLLLQSTTQQIIFNGKLSQIKEQISSPPFVLNLKSYIININLIQSFSKSDGTIVFKDNTELYIGKHGIRKIEDFQKGK
ncbi:hypothetical protein CYV26_00805 [Carnobacterium maltaromaticum]|uniref:LytR/AlgR family response regulator transcription factor n=1 Tax=Carnobacterium maltaromaticum TaxID=2751 RepID=UPI000C7705D8|nr:LytTR family DNA-binding domain-containing protein [Carnobacterium maltaromaticum]PLS37031.1 hypothetical protein CYV33_05705 [Carnobacterium maltaromaticum]PLS37845.1 hypothetical protein CYV30_05700 [Carnobacterium maltaromaticum]PLS39786.1 hypothetical protein CYV31_03685 [Carnobacterium maltaromaticum]PLS44542.1 hypothetical protein CYV28_05700 [Carnobacterium maltaromaticum]PLS46575.1 hypothetical protein CYV27_05695 [Carnobacterium maltaromaticum]